MNKQKIFSVIVLSVFLLSSSNLFSQIYGCTDKRANNYNANATDNDGSCTYNLTIYNPPVKYLLPDEIDETSGLAYMDGKLFTINDSGGLPALYAFDTTTGEIIQRISIANATNVDWESLADDDNHIYIGDFGNNSGNRDDLAIYKVQKSDIPLEGDATIQSEKITFSYPDYKGSIGFRRAHNFDCEAFVATTDSLYLFSKNHENQKTKLYRLPKNSGDYIADLITTYNTSGLITGADINRQTNQITLVGYVNNEWTPFTWLLFDYEGNNFFSGNKRRIDLFNIIATQTEAIAYTIDNNTVITSEGRLFAQTAFDFNSGIWTNDNISGFNDVESSLIDFILSPNPISKGKLNIDIEKLPVGEYQVEIIDSLGNFLSINKYMLSKKSGARIKVKVNNYVPGLYFVRISSGSQIVEKKFIKN